MQLTINVPIKADIVNGGFVVSVAGDNTTWNKSQLGHYADKSGVYIHHTNGKIIYIGKATTGNWGNFGERLRRRVSKISVIKFKPLSIVSGSNASYKSVPS
ncbi:MAG: hypothetical protein R3E61_00070 [Pseudomonadales bacterium]